KGMDSYDLADICTGRAVYGMDAHVERMVFASIEHPPVFGGKVKSYDAQAPLQVPGVRQTLAIDSFQPPCGFQPLGGIAVNASMRRPVGVKSILLVFRWTSFLLSAEWPLSPCFHPHSRGAIHFARCILGVLVTA